VDIYNKSVNEINAALDSSNKLRTAMNTGREKAMDNWNVTRKRFMELQSRRGTKYKIISYKVIQSGYSRSGHGGERIFPDKGVN